MKTILRRIHVDLDEEIKKIQKIVKMQTNIDISIPKASQILAKKRVINSEDFQIKW